MYHYADNLVTVGFVVHLNYHNPYLSPFEEFQRFKTHPLVRDTFAGGKRLCYGARAISEGGWQSVPRVAFPGGVLVGCAAGFLNVPRIKGTHNAMLSAMLAAEHMAAALAQGRAHDELSSYEAAWRASPIGRDLWRVRNAKPLWSKLGTFAGVALGGLDMWTNTLGFSLLGTMSHGKPDSATLKPAAACRPIAYPKPDGKLTFDRLSSVYLSNTNHEEDQPVHLIVRDPALQKSSELGVYAGPSARYCPAGVYEWVEEAGTPRFVINAAELRPLQNLRHQGPESKHHLGAARGRRRAELPEYVIPATPAALASNQPGPAAAISPPFGAKGRTSLRGRVKTVILAPYRHPALCSPSSPIRVTNGDLVIHPLLSRRAAVVGAVVLWSLPSALAAQAPTPQDLSHSTASGSYLAARHAGVERDSGDGRRLLPQCAQGRSAQCRSAQPHLSVRSDRRRHRRSRQARRPADPARSHRPHCAPGDRRAGAQAEAICDRPAELRAIGARSGDRSDRDAALGVGAGRRRRYPRRGRHAGSARRPGLVRHLQGPACRPDPRCRQQQEGSGQALRARLQGRPDGAAHRSGVRPLFVAQRRQGRRAEDLSAIQQGGRRSSGRSSKR